MFFTNESLGDLKDLIHHYLTIRRFIDPMNEIKLPCIYTLCEDLEIIAFAFVSDHIKISNIYTIPAHRGKGYASKLLHMLVELGVRTGFQFYAPVDKKVEGLFLKNNWKALTDKLNPDNTLDYCHTIFYRELKATYPESTVYYTAEARAILNSMSMPESVIQLNIAMSGEVL